MRTLEDIPIVMSYTGGDGNDVTLTVTNLALVFSGWRIESGNGNGLIDPDECNLLYVSLQNRRATSLSVTSAILRSTSPGAVITVPHAPYPSFSAGSIRSNATPFQLRTAALLACGTTIALELQVSVPGEGTFAIPFTVTPSTNCNPGGGGCESCTIASGRFTTNLLRTIRVPNPVGAPSECLPTKPCPDALVFSNGVRYINHAFTNGSGADACITAQLHHDCPTAPVGAVMVAAYGETFVQHAACDNYLGDAGALLPDESPPFSFTVPAGARFEIVVMELIETPECPSYWVELFGLPCSPPKLHLTPDSAPDKVLLQWSTAYPGWQLQAVENLNGASPRPFSSVSGAPAIVNAQYTVTNNANGKTRFYRLER
jgi:hypothetical protein